MVEVTPFPKPLTALSTVSIDMILVKMVTKAKVPIYIPLRPFWHHGVLKFYPSFDEHKCTLVGTIPFRNIRGVQLGDKLSLFRRPYIIIIIYHKLANPVVSTSVHFSMVIKAKRER